MKITGTAVGFVSVVGYTPDIFMGHHWIFPRRLPYSNGLSISIWIDRNIIYYWYVIEYLYTV